MECLLWILHCPYNTSSSCQAANFQGTQPSSRLSVVGSPTLQYMGVPQQGVDWKKLHPSTRCSGDGFQSWCYMFDKTYWFHLWTTSSYFTNWVVWQGLHVPHMQVQRSIGMCEERIAWFVESYMCHLVWISLCDWKIGSPSTELAMFCKPISTAMWYWFLLISSRSGANISSTKESTTA